MRESQQTCFNYAKAENNQKPSGHQRSDYLLRFCFLMFMSHPKIDVNFTVGP